MGAEEQLIGVKEIILRGATRSRAQSGHRGEYSLGLRRKIVNELKICKLTNY